MKTYTLRIEQDTRYEFESPADWDSDAVQLLVAHRHYAFGHHNFSSAEACDAKRDELKAEGKTIFPLYAYDHGGVTLSINPFSCPWDSGQIGWVAVDPTCVGEDIEAAAKSAIEEWNDYLSGNVWGYVVEDQNGDPYDSCWGYYGDPDKSGCREDGEAALKRAQEAAAKAASDQCAIYEMARLACATVPEDVCDRLDISDDEFTHLRDLISDRLSNNEAVLP